MYELETHLSWHNSNAHLKFGGQEVLNEPEFDSAFSVLKNGENHNGQETFVQMTRGNRKDVDFCMHCITDAFLFTGFAFEDPVVKR